MMLRIWASYELRLDSPMPNSPGSSVSSLKSSQGRRDVLNWMVTPSGSIPVILTIGGRLLRTGLVGVAADALPEGGARLRGVVHRDLRRHLAPQRVHEVG